MPDPAFLIVMGVSVSGKTTVAAMLARVLDREFAEGDDFHPAANVRKMAGGTPLTDEDRWPWLHAIAAWIDETRRSGRGGVVACSALKRSYRDILVGGHGDVRLVYLKGDMQTIRQRLAARRGHFMPAALLRSQFDTLEEPGPGENPIIASIAASPETIVAQVLAQLRAEASARAARGDTLA